MDALTSLTVHYDDSLVLRQRQYQIITALNSGRKKFRFFLSGRANDKIAEIEKIFTIKNQTDNLQKWLRYWPKGRKWTIQNVDEDEWKLIINSGIWLICMSTYSLLVELICILNDKKLSDSIATSATKQCLSDLQNCNTEIVRFIDNPLATQIIPLIEESIIQIEEETFSYNQQSVSTLIDKTNKLLIRSVSLIEKAELLYSGYGEKVDIVEFNYAVIVQLNPKSMSKNEIKNSMFRITAFLHKYCLDVKNNNRDSFDIDFIPDTMLDLPNSIVVISTGNRNSTFAAELASTTLLKFQGRLPLRCLVFAQIPSESRVRIKSARQKVIRTGSFWEFVKEIFHKMDRAGDSTKLYWTTDNTGMNSEIDKLPAKARSRFLKQKEFSVRVNDNSLTIGEAVIKKKSKKTSDRSVISMKKIKNSNITVIANSSDVTSTSKLNIRERDLENFTRLLDEAKLPKADIEEQKSCLDLDAPVEQKGVYGSSTKTFIGRLVNKSIEGGWDIPFQAAASVLATAINVYFGLG